MKIEYKKGDIIGENGVVFIEEKEPYQSPCKRFGKLIAMYPTEKRGGSGDVVWCCKCDCGNEHYYAGSNVLLMGKVLSCGCMCSKGEDTIKNILNKLQIRYKTQKTFSGCINPKTNRKLYFDFYLSDYNCCIEYDGKQHFEHDKNNKGWNTKEHLEKTQYLDNIKNEYCKQHSIKLIRIPYTDFDILDEKYIQDRIES